MLISFCLAARPKLLIILIALVKDKEFADELQRDFLLYKWVI